MTAGSSAVKATAKTALKNNWLKTIISSLILIFSLIFCYHMSGIFSIATGDIAGIVLFVIMLVFLISPILLGLIRFIWRMLFNADDKPLSVFYYFSDRGLYLRALKLALNLTFKLVVLGLCLNIPSIVVKAFAGTKVYEMMNMPVPIWTSNLYYIAIFLRVMAIVILLFIMIKYYIAPVLVVADDNMDVSEAIHMSATISKNTAMDLIYLFFSMIGWILLSVFVFSLVFTLPYLLTSLLVHVRFAVAEYNKHVENCSKSNYPTYVVGI